MNTYFAIQGHRKDRKGQWGWVTLQFDNYDNGIGWHDETYARAWLALYPNRKWRIVKRVIQEEVQSNE